MPGKKKKQATSENNVHRRILERAVDLFYVQGVHATGINQIIQEADVAKDTLYRQFASKDVLIQAALELWGRKLAVLWERKLRNCENPKELFQKWIRLEKESLRKEANYNGCPVATIMMEMGRSKDTSIIRTARKIEQQWIEFLASEFIRFQKSGSLSARHDANSLAREILTIYQGGLAMWRISSDVKYLDQLNSIFLKAIH